MANAKIRKGQTTNGKHMCKANHRRRRRHRDLRRRRRRRRRRSWTR